MPTWAPGASSHHAGLAAAVDLGRALDRLPGHLVIYGVEVQENDFVEVTMTLTSPACPVAGTLPGEVEQKVKLVPGVGDAKVELVWDPPWTPDKMSEAAKLELGMM